MGLPNKDEMEGKFDQAKGAVKENVGRAIDDREMETEGQADRAGGNVREGFGTARRKVGEAIEDIGDSIKH
ncbi:MAG TPA: CsbD family protein [Pyrinomonadaceae bacterium]|nr:CsbD family protein [Pyrinomonadaceae bacterium]